MTLSRELVEQRVLLVCPVGNEIGGAEQVMLAVGRELPKYGFTPTLVIMRPGRLMEIAKEQRIEVESFPIAHKYRSVQKVWRASKWLVEVARRKNAVLLHATHTAHVYAAIASRRAKIPEVWHVHDSPSSGDVVDRFQRLFSPKHTISTTSAVAAGFKELARRKFTVIAPSCVNPEHLRHQPARPDIRERLNLPAGPLLITVTRLQEHKGHADLMSAASEVLRSRRDVTFVIVGKASTPEQERYRDGLLSQADQMGLSAAVRFVGFVDDADLAELYRQAFALVHPAWSEGYGLVLLEAMGMGLPVIAAAASGPAEIIYNEENGLLVQPKNPAALAAGILRLLGDPSLVQRLVAGGAKTSTRLTLDHMMTQIVGAYRAALNGVA